MNATNFKSKFSTLADNVMSSKAYKLAERCAIAVGSAVTALGVMSVPSSAALDGVDAATVVSTAEPYINAGIPILLTIAGIRLGWRFIRGATH